MGAGVGVGVADAGPARPELAESAARRKLEQVICWALTVGVVFQVAQRFAKTGYDLSEYGRSLWYVNYRSGFVRRGLAGEIVRVVVGHTPSLRLVDFVQNVVAAIMLAGAIALVVLLCRQRTVVAYAAAALLVIAPFGLDTVGGQRRPDLFAYFLLAVVGIWAASRRANPIVVGLVGGLLLGMSTLLSEASPLIVGPWLVLVVAAAVRARAGTETEQRVAIGLCVAPSVVALLVLSAAGRGSDETVAALVARLRPKSKVTGRCSPTSATRSRRASSEWSTDPATSRSRSSWALSSRRRWRTAPAAACPTCARCGRGSCPPGSSAFAWTSTTVIAAVVLFALGFDWLRWISSIGFAALLAGGSIVLLDGRTLLTRPTEGPPERRLWHRPVPSEVSLPLPGLITLAVATYLLVLAPLPNFIKNVDDAAQTLLSVPR